MTTAPVHTITDEQIAEIEELANKATGGEWEYNLGLIRTMADSEGYVPVAIAPNCPRNWRKQRDLNMDYIVSANPASALGLITRLREAERDAARYKFLRNTGKFSPSAFGDGWALNCGYTRAQPIELDRAVDDAMQGEQQ